MRTKAMTNEIESENPISGWAGVFAVVLMIALELWLLSSLVPPPPSLGSVIMIGLVAVVLILTLKGFITLEPNEAVVLILFGDYACSIKRAGFFWVNPFYTRSRVSLRVKNFNTPTLKVNDKLGNPIEIAAADNDILIGGTTYSRDWYVVTKFERSEELGGGRVYNVTLQPTVVFNNGQVIEKSYHVASGPTP